MSADICPQCHISVRKYPDLYHTGGVVSHCHTALMRDNAALRAALDKERADGAKLRSTPIAFLMAQNDDLHAKLRGLRGLRDYAYFCATTCFEFTDQYKYAKNLGLLDDNGNPTGLLSGRGEVSDG